MLESVKPSIELAISSIPSASAKELGQLERYTERAAFDRLIARHRDVCMRWAWAIMRNQSDAEDAIQNAFRKAFQCRDQFKNRGTFAAWLHRIVKNECLMRLRKEKHTYCVYLDNPIESNTRLELVGSDMNPEDQFGRLEVATVLRKEMLHLPPLLRNVMMLYDWEQLSMPVVAKRLGLSVPAARSRL